MRLSVSGLEWDDGRQYPTRSKLSRLNIRRYIPSATPLPMDYRKKNTEAFHAPLQPNDTADKTFGCRCTNPVNCAKNGTPGVCAFIRQDGICLSPPASWKKQYQLLKAGGRRGGQGHFRS